MLEARVAALADGEMAARHKDDRPRRAHAHDAKALFAAGGAGLRSLGGGWRVRISGRVRTRSAHPVAHMPPHLLCARQEIRVRVDLLFALPLLVSPERLEQLLA